MEVVSVKGLPTLLLVLATSLIVSACAGGGGAASSKPAGGGGGQAQNVTIKSLDTLKFDPATATVRSGSPVHLTLDNSGAALIHDWVIDDFEGKKLSVEAQPRQTATLDFTPTKAGTYQFYCSQPGHKEAGMVGTLTVQ